MTRNSGFMLEVSSSKLVEKVCYFFSEGRPARCFSKVDLIGSGQVLPPECAPTNVVVAPFPMRVCDFAPVVFRGPDVAADVQASSCIITLLIQCTGINSLPISAEWVGHSVSSASRHSQNLGSHRRYALKNPT